jgi:hypothetical protein
MSPPSFRKFKALAGDIEAGGLPIGKSARIEG